MWVSVQINAQLFTEMVKDQWHSLHLTVHPVKDKRGKAVYLLWKWQNSSKHIKINNLKSYRFFLLVLALRWFGQKPICTSDLSFCPYIQIYDFLCFFHSNLLTQNIRHMLRDPWHLAVQYKSECQRWWCSHSELGSLICESILLHCF